MSINTIYRSVAFVAAILALSCSAAALPTEPVAISVHPGTVLGIVHRAVLGVNSDTRYDGGSALTAVSRVLATIGATGSRWPGGTHADMFDWREVAPNQMTPYCNSRIKQVSLDGTFDTYMNSLVNPNGLSAEITVNYGTSGWPTCSQGGDPMLAAAWVRYANVTKRYDIKWWEVGNEVYEPGEPDAHPNPHTPESYANFEPPFYAAMKAADPTINVGIPVTAGAHGVPNWDAYVLAHAKYDYVVFHYYPEFYPNISDAALLAAPTRGPIVIAKAIANIRSRLVAAGRCTSPCTQVPISISEWNSVSHNPTPQTLTIVEGLYAAETLGEFFNAGVARAEFFVDQGCQDNTPGGSGYNTDPPAPVYGWQHATGALGLSAISGIPDRSLCPRASFSAPLGTIFPSGRAIAIYSQSGFAAEGASAVLVDEPSPSVRSYASYDAARHVYVVVLINLDENSSAAVDLSIDGVRGGDHYKMTQYSKAIYDETRNNGPWNAPISTSGASWSVPLKMTLPPWSTTAYTLVARASGN